MARVKRGTNAKRRRTKILKATKGYFGAKSRTFRMAKQALMKTGNYSYIGRKQNKRNYRRLWITRISAACQLNDINYSRFINGLRVAEIELNRKMLSEIAIHDPASFTELVNASKKALKTK